MVIIDKLKLKTGDYKVKLLLRPDFGKGEPIWIDHIICLRFKSDESNELTSVDYINPNTFRSHFAYGHQIDKVEYVLKEEYIEMIEDQLTDKYKNRKITATRSY